MKKRTVATIAGVAGAVGLAMMNEDNRTKVKTTYHKLLNKLLGKKEYSTLVQAGIPDQVEREDRAQLENAKMVSEGSTFGVNYFNKQVEEEKAEMKRKNASS